MEYQDFVKTLANQVIEETIATMMDVQPITVVGQENPAKKEKKKCKENQ